MTTLPAAPGDILAVWTGQGLSQDAIRVAEALQGKPAVANHVVVVTHQDQVGRWMGIQGQPGGVGPVDCTPFLSDSRTMSNHDEPKPNDRGQLATFLASTAKSLGIAYDWVGIAEDGLSALHVEDLSAVIDPLWRWPSDHNLLPGHVVCSSLAAMLYDRRRSDGPTQISVTSAIASRPTGGGGRKPTPGQPPAQPPSSGQKELS